MVDGFVACGRRDRAHERIRRVLSKRKRRVVGSTAEIALNGLAHDGSEGRPAAGGLVAKLPVRLGRKTEVRRYIPSHCDITISHIGSPGKAFSSQADCSGGPNLAKSPLRSFDGPRRVTDAWRQVERWLAVESVWTPLPAPRAVSMARKESGRDGCTQPLTLPSPLGGEGIPFGSNAAVNNLLRLDI